MRLRRRARCLGLLLGLLWRNLLLRRRMGRLSPLRLLFRRGRIHTLTFRLGLGLRRWLRRLGLALLLGLLGLLSLLARLCLGRPGLGLLRLGRLGLRTIRLGSPVWLDRLGRTLDLIRVRRFDGRVCRAPLRALSLIRTIRCVVVALPFSILRLRSLARLRRIRALVVAITNRGEVCLTGLFSALVRMIAIGGVRGSGAVRIRRLIGALRCIDLSRPRVVANGAAIA